MEHHVENINEYNIFSAFARIKGPLDSWKDGTRIQIEFPTLDDNEIVSARAGLFANNLGYDL
jgi:hypothetical protein